MKKTLILVFALVALCLLASCNPEKVVIINEVDFSRGTFETTGDNYKKEITFDYPSVVLKEWWKTVGEEDFPTEPTVTYEGTYTQKAYNKFERETSRPSIEYESTPCLVVEFKTVKVPDSTSDEVKEGYESNLTSYSGAFDMTYVEGFKWVFEGISKDAEYKKVLRKNTKVCFEITQHPDYTTNQSKLDREWICTQD